MTGDPTAAHLPPRQPLCHHVHNHKNSEGFCKEWIECYSHPPVLETTLFLETNIYLSTISRHFTLMAARSAASVT
jgi:hypothetical protein